MDPVTQGILGAALPQAVFKRRKYLWAGLFGLVGGMAPDLDTLIRSDHDPLLYLEYHRHFTHSLMFIPFGGLLVATVMYFLIGRWKSISFWQTYLFCTLGYATHGFLDSCTSYGTVLFWPFSDMRVAFNIISIIDPLFTVPIILLIGMTIIKRSHTYARAALIWAAIYLGLGFYQNLVAVKMGQEIATSRGHDPQIIVAKPSFGNILVWKVIYREADRYYVDSVRASYKQKIYKGTSIAALDIKRDFPWLDEKSQQAIDIERFRWFSNGYVAQDPKRPNRIIDLRYSLLPNEIDGLWSLNLSPNAGPKTHGRYLTHRASKKIHRDKLLQMIFGD